MLNKKAKVTFIVPFFIAKTLDSLPTVNEGYGRVSN
jgi:hypothetical protein